MLEALTAHRLQFAFTITYHYLFPQLTMGLALLIVILKTMALRTGDESGVPPRKPGDGEEPGWSRRLWHWHEASVFQDRQASINRIAHNR